MPDPTHGGGWIEPEGGRVVPVYALTGGRTRAIEGPDMPVEALVTVTEAGVYATDLQLEYRLAVELAATPISIVEIGASLGIPVGVALLTQADVSRLKMAVGAFLVVYGLYALLAPRLLQVRGGGRAADAVVGFFGGVLGGLGGLSGVLPTIWTQLRGWPKDMARGVFQPFILMAHAATLAILGTAAPDAGARRFGVVAHQAASGSAPASTGWRVRGAGAWAATDIESSLTECGVVLTVLSLCGSIKQCVPLSGTGLVCRCSAGPPRCSRPSTSARRSSASPRSSSSRSSTSGSASSSPGSSSSSVSGSAPFSVTSSSSCAAIAAEHSDR